MTEQNLGELLAHIDHLLNAYLKAREKPEARLREPDIEAILEEGLFPPDDPSSASRLALLSIGETLGRVGGQELMEKVYDAYSDKHGTRKATSLSARWDSAANLWFY